MKATIFASVLSLFVVSIPVQAANNPLPSPTVKESKISTKIDLNKADALALSKSFKGIGKKRAEAIVKYREEHGKFKSVEDLAKVKGFGIRFIDSHLSQLQETFSVN
ncbi:MAG: helix-hairpin-helix domain-containing protein [Tatlockia sp.]|nr:helix-hairpin-helix domain-containing protein [Tatlockia sp.]